MPDENKKRAELSPEEREELDRIRLKLVLNGRRVILPCEIPYYILVALSFLLIIAWCVCAVILIVLRVSS